MKLLKKLLAPILIVSTLLCSCGSGNPYFCEPYEAQAKGFNLIITPKTELMTVLSYLNEENTPEINQQNTIYGRDIETKFKKHREHPTVAYYKEKGFDYNTMCEFGMMINKNFTLDTRFMDFENSDCSENEKRILRQVSEKADLTELLDYLCHFYSEANVDKLFKQNKNMMKDTLAELSQELDKYNVYDFTNKYFENENKIYRLVIQPIRTTTMNSEISLSLMDEDYNVSTVNYTNIFSGTFQRKYFSPDIVKEISHNILAPVFDKYKDDINNYSFLFKEIPQQPKDAGYDTWNAVFQRHLIDGIAARFILSAWGEEEYNNYIKQNEEWGLIYQRDICDKLAEFEKNLDKYGSLENFIPELLTCFDKYSK